MLLEERLGSALKKINRGPDGMRHGWTRPESVRRWRSCGRCRRGPSRWRRTVCRPTCCWAAPRSTGSTVWDGGRDQTVNYIDWDDWSANEFLAVSQFSVATPGQAPNIRPDVTLFVNGIPLVVIEAKSPGHDSGIADAIDQLRRYANQRDGEANEGAEQLFWTNQLTVATTGERAQAATFSAEPEHYLAWKDPSPATVDEVAATLGKPADAVTQQELLTAGMLAP